MILVGKIVTTFGIKGEVKVKSDSSFDRFKEGAKIYFKEGDQYIVHTVTTHRVHKNMDMIRIDGIDDINKCLQFVGQNVYIEREADELEPNQFYYDDLIGLALQDEAGKLLGQVKDIIEVPQGIILEVITIDKTTKMIPFVDEYIKEVNKDYITIHVIGGLL